MLYRSRTFALVVALLLVGSGIASAQPGRGGFGMGRGGRQGLAGLLGREAVQKELGLEGAALEKATAVAKEFEQEMTAESAKLLPAGGFASLRDLPEAERTALTQKMSELGKKLAEAYKSKVKDALSAQQFERLQQIRLQAAGIAAFSDADVVKALELTKEQQDKIAALDKEYDTKRQALSSAERSPEMFAKMQELNKERDAKALEMLSDKQKETLTTLKGKEFDLATLRGPGGPGGGGARPGGRPGAKKDSDK